MQSLNHRNRDTHRVTHMSTYDLIIKGGTVATASDTFRADIGIRDGTIVTLGGELSGAMKVIDASGRLVLPGGIDSHVHLAQPSATLESSWPMISKVAPARPPSAVTPQCYRSACSSGVRICARR